MDRLSLTTRLRRQRRQEPLELFKIVVHVVVVYVVSLWMIMVKRQIEAEEEVNIEDQTQNTYDESEDVMTTSNQGGNATMQSEETSSGRGKKRKRQVDHMTDRFGIVATKLIESLEKMVNTLNKSIEREEELDKKRSMITSEVSKMQSLTQREKFKVISMITHDTEKVKMFWDLQEADREDFVNWLLKE